MQLRMMLVKKNFFFVWLLLWLCCSKTTMKTVHATAAAAMAGGGGFGIEFGQFRPVSRRRDEEDVLKAIAEVAAAEETNNLRKTGGGRFEELLQEDRAWWESAFSMSMCLSYPAVPTTAPSKPNTNPSPTDPDDPSQPTPGGGDGTSTSVPTSPTGNATIPTNATVPPIDGLSETVFVCTDDGVQIAEPPYESVTPIQMRVGYEVESVAALDDYRDGLEYMILRTAVIGSLQCNAGGPIFGTNSVDGIDTTNNRTLNVPMTTVQTSEQCQPQLSGTTCTVYETEFQFVVEEEVDSELSAFLGYVFLQEEMDDTGAFTDAIPIIDRIKYLSPLPLLPPISDGIDQDPSSGQSGSNNEDDSTLNVSPWTVGAVLAMCIGGIVALFAWARNRRTRNERHMQLLESEDVSLNPLPEDALPRTT